MRHARHTGPFQISSTHSIIVLALVASSVLAFDGGSTVLSMNPSGPKELIVGDTTQIDIVLSTTVPVNALSATIGFPPDLIEVVSVSKEHSFMDLWTEDTAIREDAGEVHFSGGTTQRGGMVGSSTALTLVLKAKKSGSAELYFKDAKVLASDGYGTAVESGLKSFTYLIPNKDNSLPPVPIAGGGSALTRLTQNPDLNGDGKINLVDASILSLKLFGPYNPRFDLNGDGSLGLPDLSILFAKM